MKNSGPIKPYIASFSGDVKKRLNVVYSIIKSHFPQATETFAYQMPTFKGKRNLIHFAGYANHIGIYPGPKGITYLRTISPDAITSKGAWKILHSQLLPEKELIQLCLWIQKQP